MNDATKSLMQRLIDRVFPRMPDFYGLINEQCDLAVEAMPAGGPDAAREYCARLPGCAAFTCASCCRRAPRRVPSRAASRRRRRRTPCHGPSLHAPP